MNTFVSSWKQTRVHQGTESLRCKPELPNALCSGAESCQLYTSTVLVTRLYWESFYIFFPCLEYYGKPRLLYNISFHVCGCNVRATMEISRLYFLIPLLFCWMVETLTIKSLESKDEDGEIDGEGSRDQRRKLQGWKTKDSKNRGNELSEICIHIVEIGGRI